MNTDAFHVCSSKQEVVIVKAQAGSMWGKLFLIKKLYLEIELKGGTTVFDTETSKILFSPIFSDEVMSLLWEWTQNKNIHILCQYTVSEAFPWTTDDRHSNHLLRKLNNDFPC